MTHLFWFSSPFCPSFSLLGCLPLVRWSGKHLVVVRNMSRSRFFCSICWNPAEFCCVIGDQCPASRAPAMRSFVVLFFTFCLLLFSYCHDVSSSPCSPPTGSFCPEATVISARLMTIGGLGTTGVGSLSLVTVVLGGDVTLFELSGSGNMLLEAVDAGEGVDRLLFVILATGAEGVAITC